MRRSCPSFCSRPRGPRRWGRTEQLLEGPARVRFRHGSPTCDDGSGPAVRRNARRRSRWRCSMQWRAPAAPHCRSRRRSSAPCGWRSPHCAPACANASVSAGGGQCPRRAASGCMRRVSARVSRRCVCRRTRAARSCGVDVDDDHHRSGSAAAHAARSSRAARAADHPFAVGQRWRASRRVLVLVETELWPSWIAVRGGADPVAIVSGRISDRSFRVIARWRRCCGRRSCASPSSACVEEDARRFVALGVDTRACT